LCTVIGGMLWERRGSKIEEPSQKQR
jgi:hypothetical protein